MKKTFILFMMSALSLTSFSQNRWNIYAGGSISHCDSGYVGFNTDGDTNFDWGGGAFLGGGYEVNFNSYLSLNPSLEISYTDNGAYYNKTNKPSYHPYGADTPGIWSDSWSVNIPVTVGFRVPLSEMFRFKIEAGPYLSEAFHVRHYANVGETNGEPILKKKKASSDFGQDFQIGLTGGIAIETGNHFSYFFRTQYSLLQDRWSSKTLNLAIGLKYSF